MLTTAAVMLAGWLAGWALFGRPPRLRAPDAAPAGARRVRTTDPPGTLTTVVIPARDEAQTLPALLGDLAADRPVGVRIVVVDDHSTDGTAAAARAAGADEVVASPPLPPGWTGKSWACHVGAARAHGSGSLVFLDADVRLAPGALAAVLAELDGRGGLVSVQPWHDAPRPYEKLSALPNLVSVLATGVGAQGDRDRSPSGVFGPVLATSAADYARAGGHQAVRRSIVEDVALGRRYRSAGLPTAVLLGDRLARFRMYPGGPGQLVEGWTKNLATGSAVTPLTRLAAVALWLTAMGLAVQALPGVPGGADPGPAAGLAAYGLFAAQLRVLLGRVGRFGTATCACFPALLVVFVGLWGRSLWCTRVRHSVAWRGRAVPVGDTGGLQP